MLISLNWLRDFVEIPSSITPEELGLRLTMHTVEIDGIEKQRKNLEGVVVGEDYRRLKADMGYTLLKIEKVNGNKLREEVVLHLLIRILIQVV